MGYAGAGACIFANFLFVDPDAVRHPYIVPEPLHGFGVLHRPAAKALETELFFIPCLGEVCVHAYMVGASESRRFKHQFWRNGKG